MLSLSALRLRPPGPNPGESGEASVEGSRNIKVLLDERRSLLCIDMDRSDLDSLSLLSRKAQNEEHNETFFEFWTSSPKTLIGEYFEMMRERERERERIERNILVQSTSIPEKRFQGLYYSVSKIFKLKNRELWRSPETSEGRKSSWYSSQMLSLYSRGSGRNSEGPRHDYRDRSPRVVLRCNLPTRNQSQRLRGYKRLPCTPRPHAPLFTQLGVNIYVENLRWSSWRTCSLVSFM